MRLKRSTVILLFFSLFMFRVTAQPVAINEINPELLNNHWNASWITHPTESILEYGVFHFRKSFNIETIPSEFIIHVSADNRYRLFINGKAISFGPSRGDLGHWYFESIDIAHYLNKGNNVLAAVVWNFGNSKPWAQLSIKTAFIVQGNSKAEEIVNTDKTWKVIKNSSYSPAESKETIGQFVVTGATDRVDANNYPWGWETLSFDDRRWLSASSLDNGHPRGVGCDVSWVLTPRRIPMMEQSYQRFVNIRRTNGAIVPSGFIQGKEKWIIPANTKSIVLFDQDNLTIGYPELSISKGKGSEIKMIYSESLFDDKGNKGNRNDIKDKKIKGYFDCFLPDGGENRLFRPLWNRTWRYLQMEIETKDEPLIINVLVSEFTVYPLKEQAVFESDNNNLKKIWNVGWHTARLCANETYYDCPYYEQLQYVGDTRIQALISMYVSGDDRLIRNALLNFQESITYEGLTYSRYPTSQTQFIPPFSLFWVDMVHDYWTLRDDAEFIKGFIPGIDQVLSWFNNRIDSKTGMLGKVEYWNFVDWAVEWPWDNYIRNGGVPAGGRMDGQSSIITMQFVYALQRAAELNEFFGHSDKAIKYNQLAKNLIQAVYKNCWDEQRGYFADTPDKKSFSMHAQILAVLTNSIPEINQKSFVEKFIDDKTLIQPTMYFRFYLTQALKKTKLTDRYLGTLGLWETMLQNGLTTFAESPDPARSDCHAWSASPNYDFLATVVGIRPASPGFKTIQVEPSLGALKFVKGQMPHPMGLIRFDLKKMATGGIEGFVELPENIDGDFIWNGKTIPLKGLTKIKI